MKQISIYNDHLNQNNNVIYHRFKIIHQLYFETLYFIILNISTLEYKKVKYLRIF